MMHMLGHALIGLVVGVVAKLLMPGSDPGGWISHGAARHRGRLDRRSDWARARLV